MTTEKTVFDYGKETAEWRLENEPDSAVIQADMDDDIPEEDYRSMVNSGIDGENIDSREYWEGFNSAL